MWLMNPDGRRAGAFVALLGAAMVFTIYAAVVLYLVRSSAGMAFWLGIAAHLQIAIITTGFIAFAAFTAGLLVTFFFIRNVK